MNWWGWTCWLPPCKISSFPLSDLILWSCVLMGLSVYLCCGLWGWWRAWFWFLMLCGVSGQKWGRWMSYRCHLPSCIVGWFTSLTAFSWLICQLVGAVKSLMKRGKSGCSYRAIVACFIGSLRDPWSVIGESLEMESSVTPLVNFDGLRFYWWANLVDRWNQIRYSTTNSA